MRISKEDTMALIVDFQERLIPVMHNKEKLIDNTIRLIKGLKVLDIPMLVTQQYTKGLGMTIDDIKNEISEEFIYYDKISFSCVGDSEIFNKIKEVNKKNIILFGIESHICVLQTAIDLIQEGYNVIIIKDCISSRTMDNIEVGINRAIFEGAIISSWESILYELLVKAGSSKFKEISKIIK